MLSSTRSEEAIQQSDYSSDKLQKYFCTDTSSNITNTLIDSTSNLSNNTYIASSQDLIKFLVNGKKNKRGDEEKMMKKKMKEQGNDEDNDTNENEEEEYSVVQQQRKKKIRKVKYGIKMYQTLETNDVFLIEGDFLFYPKAFYSYHNQKDLERISPLNLYRQVRKVKLFDDQRIDIELDNMVDTVGNLQVVNEYLSRMNDQNTHQLRIYLQYYDRLIKDQQLTLEQVKSFYNGKEEQLIQILDSNFQQSLLLANQFLLELNKLDQICMYFIKRVSHKNLFKKSYSMGGTKHLLDVCFGSTADSKALMMEKLLREGIPNFLDYQGYVMYVLQSFSGNQSGSMDLITGDQFKIPCNIQSFMQPLSSVEIIPGCTVYDELVYTVYTPTNQKIIENLYKQRKEYQDNSNFNQLDISDFSYEAKSEQFIDKYYPDLTYQLKYKRKKPENFKKSNQN